MQMHFFGGGGGGGGGPLDFAMHVCLTTGTLGRSKSNGPCSDAQQAPSPIWVWQRATPASQVWRDHPTELN